MDKCLSNQVQSGEIENRRKKKGFRKLKAEAVINFTNDVLVPFGERAVTTQTHSHSYRNICIYINYKIGPVICSLVHRTEMSCRMGLRAIRMYAEFCHTHTHARTQNAFIFIYTILCMYDIYTYIFDNI